jgi:DNA mismatch repair protein MutL
LRIKKLSSHLANQIAAGEVVERPASIVKELLENSLDAQATQINIYLYKGGIEGIDISDNGTGIHPEDLLLSTHPHATSKLSDTDHLFNIHTFGFRGEALSSIHSIAKLTIQSKHKDSDSAWELTHKGEIIPSTLREGTKIKIRELFYSIPARKHFLKSPNTEYQHCLKIIHRIALIHPQVHIRLYADEKCVLDCQPFKENTQQRLQQIIGKEFAENAKPIEVKYDNWSLTGWLSPSSVAKKTTDKQFWYVNYRAVKDRLLSAATRRAYADLMHNHSQPEFFLHLQIPPEEVDVNVHPGKLEVRFRQNEIFPFVQNSIKKQLFQPINEQFSGATESLVSSNFLTENTAQKAYSPRVQSYSPSSNSAQRTRLDYQSFKNINQHLAEQPIDFQPISTTPELIPDAPLGQAISYIHGAFILAVNAKGLVIVDAHAAHERILYEQIKTQQALENEPVQTLIEPHKIHLNLADLETAKNLAPLLENIGIKSDFKSPYWQIHSIPNILKDTDLTELLTASLTEYAKEEHTEKTIETLYQILSTKACHQAVRANRVLSPVEMNELLRQVEECSAGERCNHGRPTWHQITLKELNQFFFRGQ